MTDTLFPIPSIRSPIRYFGGKTKAVPHLLQFIPRGINDVVSPFIGGGAFELALCARGHRVHAYDAYQPLVTAWQALLTNPEALIPQIQMYVRQFADGEINLRHIVTEDLTDSIEQAAMLICKQNLSMHALGGFNGNGYRRFRINEHGEPIDYPSERQSRLINFNKIRGFCNPHLSVECVDFRESMARHPTAFAYLDPPYPEATCLYGDDPEFNVDFPHADLASILHNRRNWMLSYNNCATVKGLYPEADFRYDYPQWSLTSHRSRKSTSCNEVLIRPKEDLA